MSHVVYKPKKKARKNLIDDFIYPIALIAPIMTIPQIFTIWVNHENNGVSIPTWGAYAFVMTAQEREPTISEQTYMNILRISEKHQVPVFPIVLRTAALLMNIEASHIAETINFLKLNYPTSQSNLPQTSDELETSDFGSMQFWSRADANYASIKPVACLINELINNRSKVVRINCESRRKGEIVVFNRYHIPLPSRKVK